MNLSILDDFQVVQSPVTSRRMNFDEFHDASTPLQTAYCSQLSEDEFEATGETETEKALKALVEHLEKDPSAFIKLLRKRKVEEMESSGVFSMLKCKLMTTLKGEEYVDNWLSKDEQDRRLQELVDGMLVVHNYAKESRRCSARLAERRSKMAAADLETTPVLRRRPLHIDSSQTVLPAPPPPPPLPPTLPRTATTAAAAGGASCDASSDEDVSGSEIRPAPLAEHNRQQPLSSSVVNIMAVKLKKTTRTRTSCKSKTLKETSIQQELLACDPIKRLRSTQIPRSPGGTPTVNPSKLDQSAGSFNWSSHLDSPEPLHAALLRVINHKFRNVRSPCSSPAANMDCQSPEPFSP